MDPAGPPQAGPAARRPAAFPRDAVSRQCDYHMVRPVMGLRMRNRGDPERGAGLGGAATKAGDRGTEFLSHSLNLRRCCASPFNRITEGRSVVPDQDEFGALSGSCGASAAHDIWRAPGCTVPPRPASGRARAVRISKICITGFAGHPTQWPFLGPLGSALSEFRRPARSRRGENLAV